jgi:excisionase family DNA binding protein
MMTTTQLAAKAGTSRHTVEREIRRGNLTAEKAGRQWIIAEAEADRWAAQFQPYAAQRNHSTPPAD